MIFQGHEAVAAGLVQQFVDQAQGVLVVLGLVLRALEHAQHAAEGFLDDLARRADQERAQRRAADDQQLVRLPQRAQLSVRQHIAARTLTMTTMKPMMMSMAQPKQTELLLFRRARRILEVHGVKVCAVTERSGGAMTASRMAISGIALTAARRSPQWGS